MFWKGKIYLASSGNRTTVPWFLTSSLVIYLHQGCRTKNDKARRFLLSHGFHWCCNFFYFFSPTNAYTYFVDNNIINLSSISPIANDVSDIMCSWVHTATQSVWSGRGSSNVRFCLLEIFVIHYTRTRAIPNGFIFVLYKHRQNVPRSLYTLWTGASCCRDVDSGSKTNPRQHLWRQNMF